VLDLSELYALEGGALGILVFLQRWARNHDIQLATLHEMMALLAQAERSNSLAA